MIIEQSGQTGRVRTTGYEEMEQEGGQNSGVIGYIYYLECYRFMVAANVGKKQ